MPITNLMRDNWCRFQGELFPEIQDAVGSFLKKNQGFVMVLEIACPENFIFRTFQRNGRPLCDRVNLARAFIAKNIGTFPPQETWSNALRSTAQYGTCAGGYCPAKYQVNPPFRGPLPNLPRAIFQGRYIRP